MARTARQLLARRVRMLRQDRGWSQEDLAEASGLHRTYVGGIERAERNCTLEVLACLAEALEVSLSELLGWSRSEIHDEVREAAPAYATRRSSTAPLPRPLLEPATLWLEPIPSSAGGAC
ncbi:MAG: helix-turn-helix transcriptional regulator [Chromatiales bacterium]